MYTCSKIWIGGDKETAIKVIYFLMDNNLLPSNIRNNDIIHHISASASDDVLFLGIGAEGHIQYSTDESYWDGENNWQPTYTKYDWTQIISPLKPKHHLPKLKFIIKKENPVVDATTGNVRFTFQSDVWLDEWSPFNSETTRPKKWYRRLWDKIKKPFKKLKPISDKLVSLVKHIINNYPLSFVFSCTGLFFLIVGFIFNAPTYYWYPIDFLVPVFFIIEFFSKK